MSYQIHTHSELRQQIHDDLRMQHPNGSSQMASPLSAILTSHALRNYSNISHEREPTNLSLVFIATSNTHQPESTPHLLDYLSGRDEGCAPRNTRVRARARGGTRRLGDWGNRGEPPPFWFVRLSC